MIAIGPHDEVCQRQDVIAVDAEDEIVVLSIEHGTYYSMKDSGKAIWSALEEPCSVSALIDKLAVIHNVERTECEQDVMEFLRELQAEQLVTVKAKTG